MARVSFGAIRDKAAIAPYGPRIKLPERYPNTVIIELPGGVDQGVQPVEITIPGDMNCPVGLTEVK